MTTEEITRRMCESLTDLRVDKGLHTTFFLQTDGHGTPLSGEQFDTWERLRRRHKRFTMHSKRDQRLNEGVWDIQLLQGRLGLPAFVARDEAQYLRVPKAARLPGGKMAGGVAGCRGDAAGGSRSWVRAAAAGHSSVREDEREAAVCSRTEAPGGSTDLELSVARARAVDRVVAALEDSVDVATGLELVRVAERVLAVADAEPIGPGTPRLTVADASVYVAERVTDGKAVTQVEVVAAVEETLPTSKWKIKTYAQELHEVSAGRLQSPTAVAGQLAAD